jgi:hypothetical protein
MSASYVIMLWLISSHCSCHFYSLYAFSVYRATTLVDMIGLRFGVEGS